MKYCKVTFKQAPVLGFAHVYENATFDCILPECEDFLEISFVEKGTINVWEGEHLAYRCPEHALSVDYNKRELKCNSDGTWHKHITVGFYLQYDMHPISEEQIVAESREANNEKDERELYAILPMDCGMNLLESSKIPSIIRGIIDSHSNNLAENRLLLTAQIMKLLSEVTKECVRRSFMSKEVTPGNILCVQKAIRYISEHVRERIKTQDIAEAVNLSPGYLGNIFKTVTGQTLTEYVNRAKLQIVKELVLSGKMSFAQAGEYVGITDASYLSRLFRKYMDTTIQKMKREL